MTVIASPIEDRAIAPSAQLERALGIWALARRSERVLWGGGFLVALLLACIATMPWKGANGV